MVKTLTILTLISFGTMAVLGFSGLHHGGADQNTCVAMCLRTFHPFAGAALAVIAFVLALYFEIIAGKRSSIARGISYRMGESPGARLRLQFIRWFSLLEHSPTA